MAAVTTIVAVAGLALAAGGAAMSYSQQRRANAQQARAEEQQKQAQAEESANRASQAAAERRTQVREQRIKRAQILQAAENTGTSGSSGEGGALGSLSTQLSANLGTNEAGFQRGQRISMFNQRAANYLGDAQVSQGRGQMYSQIGQLGSAMFSAAGGMKSIMKPQAIPAQSGSWIGTWGDNFKRVG
ncbi:MAG: hypothetical protein [Podoviridae sp. ctbj_2]|nr:MAG: hypothetical protein [Podoviridae sp. ctbj_2]